MKKSMKVKMTHSDGEICFWTVHHETHMTNIVLGKKTRHFDGWIIKDHDGYERISEGNWLNLVEYFNLVASNYGFAHNLT
jgi:hypothetical protein